MRARVTTALVAGIATFAVPATTVGKPTESQTFFENALSADAKVTAEIKALLASDAGIIDPRSGFTDVTGDGRDDALVFVTTNGAAGSVALYVFSTHGQSGNSNTDLKIVYRSQGLYRATLRVAPSQITIVEPLYAEGDDIGSPARATESAYAWDGKTFARTSKRTVRS